ncbi:Proline iminopeptidase [Stackebrandtia soli]
MDMYPPSEPYDQGALDVGDGNTIAWRLHGNPDGKPAVALHGGPGSGAAPWYARMFDPAKYRILLFDQRGAGESTPSAADYETDMSVNTTDHVVADIERLRKLFDVEAWLVFGASWGSALALTYAQRHPDAVSEIVLFGAGTNRRSEVEWMTRGLGRFFPEAWERFRDGAPEKLRDGDLSAAYNVLLEDPDPVVREAAARRWCDWEEAIVQMGDEFKPNPRFADPRFRYGFARTVTHYWRHGAWLDDRPILSNMDLIKDIPGVIVHGALDLQGPLRTPWEVDRAWPAGRLDAIGGGGHCAGDNMDAAVVAATDAFARSSKMD